MRKVAGARNPRVKNLFGYFNQFAVAEPNSLDVLILDEAHRIRESSNHRFTPRAKRSTKPQVEELLDVARVPVFLLDEHQVGTTREIGTVHDIDRRRPPAAWTYNSWNSMPSSAPAAQWVYEDWVLRLLGLSDGGPMPWPGDENYRLLLADTPEQLEAFLEDRLTEGYAARMAAGFCWPWSDAVQGEPLQPMCGSGSGRPWNNKEERKHEGAPGRSLWATDDGGFGQIGCVYTAQGFEYDWSGVILGADLVWRDGRFVSDVRESKDPAFRGRTVPTSTCSCVTSTRCC